VYFQPNGLCKLPADFSNTTQFYLKLNHQKNAPHPHAEGGQVEPVLGGFSINAPR
jgi:hypothetical protein